MLRPHFITIEQLELAELEKLLHEAEQLNPHVPNHVIMQNHAVALMLLEPSTRTRISFELAAKRLGAHTVLFDAQNSALKKGESLEDTLMSLKAMGCNFCVIRHSDNLIFDQFKPSAHIPILINAGIGTKAHPTQALTDMLTIKQTWPHWHDLKVAIIGDISHSRVAQSNVAALLKLQVPDIRFIAPKTLLPKTPLQASIRNFDSLEEGLKDVHVIMTLRLQKERMQQALDERAFCEQYTLKDEHLALADPQAILMHPGPVNRDIELSADLVEHPQSRILKQVENGVRVRMALFQSLVPDIC